MLRRMVEDGRFVVVRVSGKTLCELHSVLDQHIQPIGPSSIVQPAREVPRPAKEGSSYLYVVSLLSAWM